MRSALLEELGGALLALFLLVGACGTITTADERPGAPDARAELGAGGTLGAPPNGAGGAGGGDAGAAGVCPDGGPTRVECTGTVGACPAGFELVHEHACSEPWGQSITHPTCCPANVCAPGCPACVNCP